MIGVIGTDEARCCYQAQGYGSYWAGVVGMDVYDITFNSQNQDITGFWAGCYQGIANANAAILYIPKIQGFAEPTVQTRLEGEAHFMRALYYFYLVQILHKFLMLISMISLLISILIACHNQYL